MSYPAEPGFKRTGTSEDAATLAAESADVIRQRVLDSIRKAPKTADEVAADLGLDILTVRPRCSELVARRLIMTSGDRRPNRSGRKANVWRAIVPAGKTTQSTLFAVEKDGSSL